MKKMYNQKLAVIVITIVIGLVDILTNLLFSNTKNFNFTFPLQLVYFFGAQVIFCIGIYRWFVSRKISMFFQNLTDAILVILLAVFYRFIFPL